MGLLRKIIDYFKEKRRMTANCEKNCDKCPLYNNCMELPCDVLEMNFPRLAIDIVQKWSDENPDENY